jgi:hypothetical protein
VVTVHRTVVPARNEIVANWDYVLRGWPRSVRKARMRRCSATGRTGPRRNSQACLSSLTGFWSIVVVLRAVHAYLGVDDEHCLFR